MVLGNKFKNWYAQKRPTKRAPDAGDSAHIPSSFLHLIFFLVGRLRRPHPSAGNANRWVASLLLIVRKKSVKTQQNYTTRYSGHNLTE